jgi:hypothetical protein
MKNIIYGDVMICFVQKDADISEEYSASVFRVKKVSRARKHVSIKQREYYA